MTEEFYIGQIFEGIYPPEVAMWCNKNNALIVEIDPITKEVEETYIDTVIVDGVEVPEEKTRTVEKTFRRYQIQEKTEPTEEEVKQRRIAELKAQLNSTDYVVIKIAESDDPDEQAQLREHYAGVIANRKAWRDEINELEE